VRVEKFLASSLRDLPMKAKEAKQRWMATPDEEFPRGAKAEGRPCEGGGAFTNFTAKLDVNKETLKSLELRARKALGVTGRSKTAPAQGCCNQRSF